MHLKAIRRYCAMYRRHRVGELLAWNTDNYYFFVLNFTYLDKSKKIIILFLQLYQ